MPSPNGRAARGAAGAAAVPRRLEITLVPRSLWAYNLQEQLGEELWKQLERAAHCDSDSRCYVCGSWAGNLEPIWKYDERRSMRSLLGFEVLCALCYFGRHPGHASSILGKDELAEIFAHYRQVNGIESDVDWLGDLDAAFTEWHRRNLIEWRTDLGVFGVFARGRQRVS